MVDLQLVYMYIENSYSGIGDIELQLCNGKTFEFLGMKQDHFYMKYYFKSDVEQFVSADTFFDSNKRLKRIDVLVGENGTGKTTILNTMAGIGIIGSWIELYYSYDTQKYYFYSEKNAFIQIDESSISAAKAYLNDCELEEIDLKHRQVFLHSNEYRPEFLWTIEDEKNKNIMESNYQSVGRFLFNQEFEKHNFFNVPNSFTFEIGLLTEEIETSKVIELKKEIIRRLKNQDEYYAIRVLEQLIEYSLIVLRRVTVGIQVVSKEELQKRLDNLKQDLQALIQCLDEIANQSTLSLNTNMRHETSGMVKVIDENEKVNQINIELEVKFQGREAEQLLMKFLMIMDRLNVSKKIYQFQLIYFHCGFRTMSSGELAYLSLHAEIYSVLEKHAQQPGLLLLLFDEPETYMHPEWSRKMISNIVRLITELYSKHDDWIANCQVLITTHTPYLLSDLLPSFITRIRNGREKLHICKGEHTFAANLYDILNSNFFVANPIGEFAKSKLDNILTLKDCGTDVKAYQELIENVGDQYLRKQLERILGY